MTGAALAVNTGHAGRLGHRGGLPARGLVGARGMRRARTGLACGAASGGTLHPDADRPVACQSGCHLDPSAVKAAAVLAALSSSRPCGMACGQP